VKGEESIQRLKPERMVSLGGGSEEVGICVRLKPGVIEVRVS
jgi:hypothetical protein